MKKSIILFVQGGAGDVLAHTPMIRGFRNKYPDDEIVVISTYSDLLKYNPNIDVLLNSENMEDFYGDHILEKDLRFFKKHFVYDGFRDEERSKSTCLPEFICRMYGIAYDGEKLDYYSTPYERRAARTFLNQYNRPVILLHTTGSIPSENNSFRKVHGHKDLNPAIVVPLIQKHGVPPTPGEHNDKFYFIQIGLEGEPKVEGSIDALGLKLRESIALVEACHSFIFIESIFAHCAAAFEKKGVVVFQNTDPEFFGYKTAFNAYFSGGCPIWPCNRPITPPGLDLNPGFKNPKTRERELWVCPKQVCAEMPPEKLESVFLDAVGMKKTGGGAPTLAAVRKK